MHPDLDAVERDLVALQARAHQLADAVDERTWTARPTPDAWSMSECLRHLSLSNSAYFDALDSALATARQSGRKPPTRYHRDIMGWMLSKSLEPPSRYQAKTHPSFVPDGAMSKMATLADFDASQAGMLERLRRSEGLDISAVKVTSAFNPRIRYTVYSAFRITTAHQRRHLLQAERAGEQVTK